MDEHSGIIPLAGIIFGATVAIHPCTAQADHAPDRQAEVAQRGAEVMPFDLTRTAHFFGNTAQGGVETHAFLRHARHRMASVQADDPYAGETATPDPATAEAGT